jgi:hypothetical protein
MRSAPDRKAGSAKTTPRAHFITDQDEFRQLNFALAEFRLHSFVQSSRIAGFIDLELAGLLALGVLWAWAVIVTTGGAA